MTVVSNCYNIWHTVYWVNVQHNHYLFTHLTYVLLLCYHGKHWMQPERSDRAKVYVDAQKLMPYLCQDALASFLSILVLRLVAVIIVTSYWRSRCFHPFVPLLVTLTYSSNTVHQRIVHFRRSNSFSVKLLNSLLQTYGLQNSPETIEYEVLCRIVFIRCQFETWPIWSRTWMTHGMDCRGVSLMLLANGERDLGPALRKREDILNICYNNWTWTHLVVQSNLCFRLCNNRPNLLSLYVSLCTWLISQGSVATVSRWVG